MSAAMTLAIGAIPVLCFVIGYVCGSGKLTKKPTPHINQNRKGW
jgi:hypothetical protein